MEVVLGEGRRVPASDLVDVVVLVDVLDWVEVRVEIRATASSCRDSVELMAAKRSSQRILLVQPYVRKFRCGNT